MDHNELLSKVTSWHLTSSNVTLRIQMTKLPFKKKKKRPMIWFLQYWHISLCWALERHLLKTTKNNNKNPFFIFTKNTYEITKMNQFFFFITCYEFNCDNTKWQAFPIWIKISNDLYHIIEGFGFGGPKKMREGAL